MDPRTGEVSRKFGHQAGLDAVREFRPAGPLAERLGRGRFDLDRIGLGQRHQQRPGMPVGGHG
jgi:hypothetical protein